MLLLLQWPKQLNSSLEEIDPEIADIIELEKARQWKVYKIFSFIILLCYFLVSLLVKHVIFVEYGSYSLISKWVEARV